jgi:hypothetical protein
MSLLMTDLPVCPSQPRRSVRWIGTTAYVGTIGRGANQRECSRRSDQLTAKARGPESGRIIEAFLDASWDRSARKSG